jgi:hypothetical protein
MEAGKITVSASDLSDSVTEREQPLQEMVVA